MSTLGGSKVTFPRDEGWTSRYAGMLLSTARDNAGFQSRVPIPPLFCRCFAVSSSPCFCSGKGLNCGSKFSIVDTNDALSDTKTRGRHEQVTTDAGFFLSLSAVQPIDLDKENYVWRSDGRNIRSQVRRTIYTHFHWFLSRTGREFENSKREKPGTVQYRNR